jgi:eukaryotic-like serine/threonine-protein kinase
VTPSTVGPYRVLHKLGSGGMGEVFLAEDERLRRKVALKSLTSAWTQGPEGRRRLLREARAVAALNHPNIAAVYDVLETADGDFIVMEYVPGQTLAERLTGGPMTAAAVLWIGAQICDALSEAHAHGLIHRDLKPANILLTPAGRVKILDFGLARTLAVEGLDRPGDSVDLSASGRRLVGTPAYIPPEHLLGRAVDERGDVYSLGVTLYELATGRRPFQGADLQAIANAILNETPRLPEGVDARIPPSLLDVIGRAMARDPERRPRTAAALKTDLLRVRREIADSGIPTEEGWWSGAVSPPARSRRRLAWGAALVLSVCAGAAAWLLPRSWPRVDEPRTPVVAVLPLDAAGDPASETLGAGSADLLVATLARLPGVNVLSRGATASYRARAKGTGAIARELGADFVVDGTIQRAAGKVRVTFSLVRAGSEVVLWGDAHEGALEDVLRLQREAVEAVADALRVRIPPADRERVLRASTSSADAFADFAQARSFLERFDVAGNVDRAITLFESALARDPSFALARAGLGQAYWQKHAQTREPVWAEKASEAIDAALSLDPQQPAVRYSLALLYKRTGEPARAIEELRRVIALQPSSDEAHNLLGNLLVEKGQVDAGLRSLHEAIRLRPSYWSNHYALGVACFDVGRYPEALAAFRRVVELQPDNGWGYQMLGTTLYVQGDRRGAIEALRESIRVAPNAGAWSNLGTAYYAEGRFEEALGAYRECARLEPRAPLAHRNAGDALLRLGRAEEARAAYLQAVELAREGLAVNPNDAAARASLGVYLAKAGRLESAREEIAKAVKRAPDNAEVLYQQAVVAALSNRPGEGLRALARALDHGWSPALAKEDDDLRPLREHPEFGPLLSSRAAATKGDP